MSNFNRVKIEVREETDQEASRENRVVKLDLPSTDGVVRDFDLRKANDFSKKPVYQEIKKKFGPLAMTDPERKHLKGKSVDFTLSRLSKTPLGIEKEEKRAVEELVESRLKDLREETIRGSRDRGIEIGRKEGFEVAHEAFVQGQDDHLRSVLRFLESFETAREKIFAENEQFLIHMIFQIAKRICLKEIEQDPKYIERLVSNLIEKVQIGKNLTVKVANRDLESVRVLVRDLDKRFEDLTNVQVEAVDSIDQGCIVETDWSRIDARLSNQIESIYESLFSQKESSMEEVEAEISETSDLEIPPDPENETAETTELEQEIEANEEDSSESLRDVESE